MKFLLFLLLNIISMASYGSYEYRKATIDDVSGLLDLINTQAIHDRDKIVILPKIFRESALKKSIESGRMFVAVENDSKKDGDEKEQETTKNKQNSSLGFASATRIVGYKKLFLLNNDVEKESILTTELRCADHSKCTFTAIIDNKEQLKTIKIAPIKNVFNLCIYNGADFTMPAYRGKGISKRLTDVAFLAILSEVQKCMERLKVSHIALVYGVTKENAGKEAGDKNDRTISISKSFIAFLEQLKNNKNKNEIILQHFRYPAFMPTFDPESQVLQPLPDNKSVQGYGCVLTCQIAQGK